MPYTGTNNYNQIDTTIPNGAVEPVLNLAPAVREIKLVASNVMQLQHGSDGSHSVSGVIPASALVSGSITNTQIAPGTILASNLASGVLTPGGSSITGSQIANNTITAANIANATITQTQLANKSVGAAQLLGSGTAAQIPIAQSDGTVVYAALSGGATMTSAGVVTLVQALNLPVVLAVDTTQGTFSAASWNLRTFSKTVDTQNVATFSGSQFTLNVGSYMIIGTAMTYNTGLTQLRVSSGASGPYTGVVYGLSSFAGLDACVGCDIFGVLVVTDATVQYHIEHYAQYTHSSNDRGLAVGVADKYGELLLVKYV